MKVVKAVTQGRRQAGISLIELMVALVISVIVFTIGTVVFDIDPSVVPEWARSIAEGVEG